MKTTMEIAPIQKCKALSGAIAGKRGMKMLRRIEIVLPDDVADRMEIRAAIDDLTLAQGIERLLCHLYDEFTARRHKSETSVPSLPS